MNLNHTSAVRSIIVVFVVLAGSLWWFHGCPTAATDIWKSFSQALTLELVLIGVFCQKMWAWKLFQGWLVLVPDIRGTWKGETISTWVNPDTGKRPAPIPTMLTITQSLFNVSCVLWTGESRSDSGCSCFHISPESQKKELAYIYLNTPKKEHEERSSHHEGAAVFHITETNKRQLLGRYWTDRKTTGDIRLEFYSKKLFDCFPEDLGKHPVSGK